MEKQNISQLKKRIKELEQENKKLTRLAFFDPLTATYNRTWFNYNIHSNSKEFLVIVDLNNLKGINDTLGHQKGDNYILQTVKTLKSFGNVVRYGGDEFIVLCKSKKAFDKLIALKNTTFSKGGAQPEEYASIAKAIAIADKRLYEDKRKNNIME